MKIGKKEKIYGLVLGLASAAFVADRLFSTPASCEAGEVTRPHPATQGLKSNPTVEASFEVAPDSPSPWLAERLRTLPRGSDNTLNDVFAAPEGWIPKRKVVAAAAADDHGRLAAAQFRRNHQLVGVVIEARGGKAVVDDRLITIGTVVDGFRLVSLTPRSAQFVGKGVLVSLPMTGATASTGGAK